MAREFKLPDLGEGIHEGEIVEVLVSQDEEVEEDQPILEVETDKAVVEIPSPFSGSVAEIHVDKGDLVQVGDVMITFAGIDGAEEEAEPEQSPETKDEAEPEKAEEEATAERPERHERPVPASPSTRRLARELEVDLRQVPGSGPGGRVTSDDVRAFAESREPEPEEEAPPEEKRPAPVEGVAPMRPSAIPVPDLPDFSHWGEVERVPLRSVRRSTARHMALAWSQIPHVSHQDVADVTELEAFRQRYKAEIAEQGGALTLTVFVLKAATAALKAHPRFNASLDADTEEIILKRYYHIGIAVDTDRGLVVPVIRDVDRKSITELAVELQELVERARDNKASLEDMQGGTFTITNPGPLGGTAFAPIINYPEVAILGMAQARWQPVVQGEGKTSKIVPRLLLPLVLSFDHRVVDGADAARFVRMIQEILQDPDRLLVRV